VLRLLSCSMNFAASVYLNFENLDWVDHEVRQNALAYQCRNVLRPSPHLAKVLAVGPHQCAASLRRLPVNFSLSLN